MQRAGGLEVADAVMIDDTKDRGVLKTGNGLGRLVVVGEDDELTPASTDSITRGSAMPASASSLADSAGS